MYQYLYLPITSYRSEEIRVIGEWGSLNERESLPNIHGETLYRLELRRKLEHHKPNEEACGPWINQGNYRNLETAIQDALNWYPTSE